VSPSSPIVVMDSGLGGLTVVRAIRAALPHEDVLYFGDTARVPYGGKSPQTVTTFVRQIIAFFRSREPKHVVIGCNTATAMALSAVRKDFPELSISGVIEPGARAAAEAAGKKEFPLIGVIATEGTIRSRAYEFAIVKRRAHARLLNRPTPLLVPIIEEGRGEDDPVTRLALKQYLLPMYQRGMDVLVLGCTHYPILKGLIQRMVGERVSVVDSAEACAEDVARRLRAVGLLRGDRDQGGALQCFVTDNTPRFKALAARFLGVEIGEPTQVDVEELYALSRPWAVGSVQSAVEDRTL
jgi:glutamate racemase